MVGGRCCRIFGCCNGPPHCDFSPAFWTFLPKDHPDRAKIDRFSAKLRKLGLREESISYACRRKSGRSFSNWSWAFIPPEQDCFRVLVIAVEDDEAVGLGDGFVFSHDKEEFLTTNGHEFSRMGNFFNSCLLVSICGSFFRFRKAQQQVAIILVLLLLQLVRCCRSFQSFWRPQ